MPYGVVQYLLDKLYEGYAVAIGYVIAGDGRSVLSPRLGHHMRWKSDDRVVVIIRHAPKVGEHFMPHTKHTTQFWDAALKSFKYLKGKPTIETLAAQLDAMEDRISKKFEDLDVKLKRVAAAVVEDDWAGIGGGGSEPPNSNEVEGRAGSKVNGSSP